MIILGIIIAIILVKMGFFDHILGYSGNHITFYILASFIAGVFFTSAFTLAPSAIVLFHIAEQSPISYVIFFGALGALLGDLLLFYFIRDRFSEDIKKLLKKSTLRHIVRSFHFGFLRWFAPIVGALIIASPLPDEFGISLLGMSKVRLAIFIPISFIMNAIGIYFLIQFAQAL